MGLLTENNDPTNKGDYHEAFNLGLDPSLSPESMSRASGKMTHGENQWPAPQDWDGAGEFVSSLLSQLTPERQDAQVLC